jgi:hypothetical protein
LVWLVQKVLATGRAHYPPVEALKSWLAGFYRDADADLRDTVVLMLLEHLLEDPEIAAYFSDWREDPTLREAYEQAMEWAIHHHPPQHPAGDGGGSAGH